MSTTLLVSDLHLQESRPDLTDIFLRFLRTTARTASGVYILGDLFESWIGDDDDSALALDVQRALRELTDSGVPCGFMAGNRDFLVGERFADATGVVLLGDSAVVDLYGTPTLLLHGDTLCTDDTEYLKVRAMFRDPAWQRQFLAQPLAARRAFAEAARAQSRAHTNAMAGDIMDVAP
ncbi:MAG TPA: UDP-2,3-diacylglucosamine diphosphatase, partial [Tahibacter sp.]|nr:UDP-2,3-diacylglucosamine diphosphatase [Tahibacter sp.]